MKYMVMECHPGYAVVLDEEGRFQKCANMGYEIGQTLTDVVLMRRAPERTAAKKWLYPLVTMAACLALMLTALFAFPSQPYASVYISINPEVRIDVDQNDRVVGLTGVNADGVSLIRNYNYTDKVLDTVMDELVDLAIEQGYLHEGGQITLTLDAKDQTWVTTHSDSLTAHLQTHLAHHPQESFTVNIQITLTPNTQHHGSSDYGHTNYGDTDYGQTQPPATSQPPAPSAPAATTDYDDGKTDFEAKTDYTKPTAPAETTPVTTEPPRKNDGETDYDDRKEKNSDYNDKRSDYDDDDDDDDRKEKNSDYDDD